MQETCGLTLTFHSSEGLWAELWCAGLVLSNESEQTEWTQWARAEISWCFVSASNPGDQCAAMTLVVFSETPSWDSLIKWKWIERATQSSVTGQGQKVSGVAAESDERRGGKCNLQIHFIWSYSSDYCPRQEKQYIKLFPGIEAITNTNPK